MKKECERENAVVCVPRVRAGDRSAAAVQRNSASVTRAPRRDCQPPAQPPEGCGEPTRGATLKTNAIRRQSSGGQRSPTHH